MQCNKQLKTCRRFEVRTGVCNFLFCMNTENAMRTNSSPQFTAFTARKYVRNTQWNFFSPQFTAFHTKIHCQTSTWVVVQRSCSNQTKLAIRVSYVKIIKEATISWKKNVRFLLIFSCMEQKFF